VNQDTKQKNNLNLIKQPQIKIRKIWNPLSKRKLLKILKRDRKKRRRLKEKNLKSREIRLRKDSLTQYLKAIRLFFIFRNFLNLLVIHNAR
jgi:hypothetical protein